jgi:hypothetical protein
MVAAWPEWQSLGVATASQRLDSVEARLEALEQHWSQAASRLEVGRLEFVRSIGIGVLAFAVGAVLGWRARRRSR